MILAWLWLFIVGVAFLLSLLCLIGEWRRRDRVGTEGRAAPVLSDIMPRQEEATQGSYKRFECQVTGTPQPEVTWYKDDIEITHDPQFQFSFQNGVVSCLIRDVKPDNAGCYTCRAENSEGSALAAAFLSIRDVSEEVVVEEGACFSEKPTEQEAATGFQDRLSSKPRSLLDHEGVLESDRKADRSQSGSLDDFVDAFVDELLGKPQGGVSNEGDGIFSQGRLGPETDSVQLKTDASALKAGSPNGEAEELQQLLALAEDGFARAENLGREAEGEGRRLKQTDSETGEIRTDSFGFGDKPAIVMEIPANICVKEGETITIKCRIAAFPIPDVSWFKDGEPLRPDKRHVIKIKDDMFSLEVRDAEAIDAGEYTITAINPEGKIYYNVRVEVLEKGTEKGAKGKTVRKPPEFVEKPASMTVTEFEQLKLWCVVSGAPAPSVTWFREGKVLKDDGRTDIYNDGDKHCLLVTKAFLRDAGEYTCTANNAVGAVFCSVYVTVEGATEGESGASTDYDLAVIEKLSPLIYEEIAKIQDEPTDEELFREYILKTSYTDLDKEIVLNEGEVIEVLDQENPELWLVRKQEDKRKICKVPSNLLKPKYNSDKNLSPEDEVRPALARMQELTIQDAAGDSPEGHLIPERRQGKLSHSPSKRTASSEGGDSSEDEDKLSKVEKYPVYIAIAEYTPPESDKDAPKLTEGQFVYVLDSKNPDRWYIQTKPTKTHPSRQGWVPPCYLDKKAGSGYIDKRSTREIFREDIIQITNKQTEALMKRRYALTELLETERDYVKELKLTLDQFNRLFKEKGLPGELVDKKELLLANLNDLYNFHNDVFLSELMTCTNDPNGIGESFMKMESKFNEYIPFLKGRPGAEILLSQSRSKQALDKFERKSRLDTQCDMQNSLRKPRERLRIYEALLKDLLRYTSRAGEKVPRLEEAIAMVMKIPQTAEDRLLLESIEEFPGDLLNMGNLIRHDDFIVWDAEAIGRGRDRHCLLFPDKIVMVKCKRPASHTDLPAYTYKGTINVSDVQINELVVDDEKFELWYAVPNSEKVTFEARNVHNKQAWVLDLRQLMSDMGVEGTDLPVDRIPEVQMKYTSSPLPRKKLSLQEPRVDLFLVQDSDKGTDYNTAIDSYESDISTQDTSSYHTALDYDYDNITKPVYMKKLRKMRATEGDAVKFECVVVGNPAPQITWFKDTVPLVESNDVAMQSVGDRHSVVVRDVLRDDSGIYTVSAANEHGNTDCSAQLLVCPDGMDETSQMTSDGDYGTAASIASEEGNSEIEATTPRLIRMPPEVMNIRLGDEARIDCSILAYPEADIIWFKNGKEVFAKDRYRFLFVDDETYSLVIHDCQPEDTGIYTCIARNKHGECKADIKLTVSGESEHRVPTFTKHLEDTRVIEGEKVTLECCVDGNPEPDFAWLCNDEIILPSEDFLMRFDGEACTFIIKETFPEDAGIYMCQMTNSAGTAETRARLTVDREEIEVAPEIQGFQDLTVEQGTACSFECIVTGSPIPEVTWSFNGEKVKSAGNIKLSQDNERYGLSIVKASPKEIGEYSCTATNKVGTAKCAAQLTVKEQEIPPKIVKELEDVTVEEGKGCTLECTISGKPQPEVVWMLNGKKIESTENIKLLQTKDKHTLKIAKASEQNVGEYCISATNSAGTIKCSANLSMKAKETAPKVVKGLVDVTIQEGESCSFSCSISGEPQSEVVWSLNGKDIKSSDNIKVSQEKDEYILKISNVSQKDAGDYCCSAKNSQGTVKCTGKLHVKDLDVPPKIEKGFEDMTIESGKSCSFECSVSGKPSSDMTWSFNGKALKPSTNIKLSQDKDRCTLTITKVSPKESGEYSCTAKNSAWSVACAAKLTVKEADVAPKIDKCFEDRTVDTGKSCTFECSISGKPSPGVTWTLNGKPIKPTDKIKLSQDKDTHSLNILKATPKDSGEYTCTAKNTAGSASCTANLNVKEETKKEKPVFATKPSDCEVADGKTAKFVCTFKDKTTNVQWLKDGKELKPSTHFIMELNGNEAKLLIDNAALGDSGNYTCVAVNDSGKMEATAELRVGPPPPDDASPAVVFEELDCDAIQPVQMMSLESMALEPLIESNVNTQMERGAGDKVQVFIAPNKLKYTEIDPETIRLSWEPAETVVNAPMYYNIDFRESTIQIWQPLVHGLAETTYTVNNLDPKKSYVFRVASQTEYGISHTSPELTMPTRAVPTVAEEKTVFDVASANLETVYFAPYPEFPNEDPPHIIVNKDSVTLKWGEAKMPPGKDQVPTFYDVEGREGERPDWTPVAEDLTDTAYTVEGLRPDEEYEFRVQPKNEHGPGKPTKPVKVHRRGGPPSFLPTIPEYEELGPDAVKITWRAAEVPKECSDLPVVYTISMKEEIAADFTTIIKDLKKTNLNITDLEPSKAYCFRIQANNEFGPSETCVELTIPERAVPMAPVFTVTSSPTLTKVEKHEIHLSWSSAETPKGAIVTPITYTVQARESTEEEWKAVADDVKDTTAKVKGMAPEKEYALRVKAKNACGDSEPTEAVTLAKRAGPPEMPSTAPKYTEKSPETIDLTWSAATTTKGYYESKITYTVDVREESVTTWKTVEKGLAKTTTTVSNLEPNKAYAIQVTAQNEYGSSKPTDEVKVPVRGVPGAPEWDSRKAPEIYPNKDGTLKLSWSNATLPAGAKPTKITYTVEIQEGSGDWIVLVDGLPDTQFNVKGADPKVNTSYRIQAANEFGHSEPSEAAEIHRSEALPEFPTDEPPSVLHLGKDSVKLTWPAATLPSDVPFCPTLYNIEEKSEEEEAWSSVVEDVAETEYTIKGVRPDRECQYRVHPKNKHGFGRPTKAKRVPRRAGPPNLLPTIPEYDEISPDEVELTWKPAETPKDFIDAPVQYTVEMKDEVSPDWQVIAKDLSDPSYTVQDLEPSKKYQFRIQACNEYGPSDSCMELDLPKRKIPMPPKFTVVGVPNLSKVEGKTPILSWAPADTPEGGRDSPITYTVEAKEKDSNEWTPIANKVKDTNCKVEGVKPDKEYELRVQATNEFGSSEPTEPVVLPKRAGPPELLKNALDYEEKQPDTIELKWKKAQTTKGFLESPITYNIEMREETSQKWTTLVKGIAKITCRIADLEPNLAYVFRVTALNEYGQSQPTEELVVKERTKPLPPTITSKKPPTVSDVKDNSLSLSWDGAETRPDGKPSPMTYTIETKDGADGKWRPLVEGLADTNFKVEGVSPDTEHSYRIKAKNEFGESEPSDAVNVAKRAGPPLMPAAEPEYSEVNSESVKLSWKPAETAKGFLESPITYNIEIREESATEWKPLAQDITATTYTADHLEPSKAYVFRVTAKNQFGESDHCKDLHVPDRLVAVPPQFPSDEPPNPSKLEKDSLTLTWLNADVPKDSKPSTVTYTVEAKEGAGDWKPVATNVKDTIHKVTGVKPTEDVEFRVKAENEFGSSEPTKIAKVEKRAGAPQMKDTTPKFAEVSPKEVELTWDAATDTKGYLKSPITYSIEIKEESVGEWKPLTKGVANASYTMTDLDPKKAFEFKISAQNEYGTSEMCQQVKVPDRMKPMPPKASTKSPEISKLDDNSLTMSWPTPEMPTEAKPSPITYDIEEKDAKGNWKPIAEDLKETNHKIEGVAPDKEHEYRVHAKNEFGKGEPTKPVKVDKRAGPPVMKKGEPEFSEINPETIELSWDAAAEESGYIKAPITYDIEMREENTKEFKPIVMDLAKTSFKVSDLEPSKAFVFKVTAKNEFGPSEVCQELKVPDRLKPLPPAMSTEAPKLEKVEKDAVKLAWSPAEFPKHAKPSKISYTVEEKDGSAWKPVAEDVKDTGTSVKGLAPDTEHELRVVAKNEFGASEPTQSVKLDKRAGPPVMKKTTPKFKEVNPETVELSWEAATEEKGHIKVPISYDVEMREDTVTEWKPLVKDNAKTTYTVSDLEPSKAFVFRVTAKNEYGTSEVSQELTVQDRMKELPPQLVQDAPAISDLGKDSLTLTWPEVKQPKHAKPSNTTYTVEVKENGSKDWKLLAKDLTEPKKEVKGIKPDQSYEYRVNAKNEFGQSEPTKPAKVEKRAGPPVMKKDKPEFKEISPDVVELKWKPAEDKKDYIKSTITYTVEFKEESGKDFKLLSKSLEKPVYKAKDLDPCVSYTFKVTAQNEYGTSDVSAELTVPARQVKVAPEMPDEAPKVSKLEKDTCTLSWPEAKLPKNAKPSPLTYIIEVKVNSSKDWKEVAKDLKDAKHNIKDVKPDQEYEYRILAKNEFGTSKPSKSVKVEKRAGPPVLPKDVPEFKEIKPEVVELKWKKADDQKGFVKSTITYIVEYKEEKAKDWKKLADGIEKPTYKASDLTPSKAYNFRVIAKNEFGNTEPTKELLVPKRLIPKPPVMIKDAPKTSKLEKDSVELSWPAATLPEDAKPSPSTYTVEIKEGDSKDWKPVAKDLSETTHKVKDIKPDRDYEIRVVAKNEFGNSEPTKAVKIEKRAGPPTLSKDAPKYKEIKPEVGEISWQPAKTQKGFLESPVTYQVEMKSEKDKKWTTVAKDIKDVTFKAKDLDPCLAYEFRVTAKNDYGASEPTRELTVEARLKKVAPAMPTEEPKITGLDTESPTLAWSPAKPEEGTKPAAVTYKIEAKEGENGDWKVIAKDLKDPKHKLKDLKPDQEYQVRVVAENKFGLSEPTKAIKMEKRAGPPTMPIDAPTLSDLNKENPILKWSPAKTKEGTIDSPISYTVEAKENGTDKWKVIAKDLKDPKCTLKDLKPEKGYEIRVAAKNKFGGSEATKPVMLEERTGPPGLPLDAPTLADLDKDSPKLFWLAATTSVGNLDVPITYAIEVKDNGSKDWKVLAKDVKDTQHTLKGLVPDKGYEFRVSAVNKFGASEATKPVTLVERLKKDKSKKDDYKAKKDDDKVKIKDDDKAKKDNEKVKKSNDKTKKDDDKSEKDEAKAKKDDEKSKKDDYKAKKDDDEAMKDDDKANKEDDKTKKVDDKAKKDDDKAKKDDGKAKKDDDKAKKVDDKAKKDDDKAKKVDDKSKKDDDKAKKDDDKAKKDHDKAKKHHDDKTKKDHDDKAKKDDDKAKKDDDKAKKDHDDKAKKDDNIAKKDDDKAKKDDDKAKKKDDDDDDKAKKDDDKAKKDDDKAKKDDDKSKKDDDKSKKDDDKAKKNEVKAKKYDDPAKKDNDKTKKCDDKITDEINKDGDNMKKDNLTGPPIMPLEAPTVSSLEKDSPKLTWPAAKVKEGTVETPVTYALELKEWGKDWKVVAKDIKDTKHTLKGLKPDMAYEVRVTAKNKYGESDPTKPAKIPKKKVAPVMPPEHPKISDLEADSLTLTWKEASQQEHAIPSKISYIVEEKVGARADWKEVGKDIPKPTFRVKGLHPEEDCAYRIIAKSEFGKSDPTKHIILPMQTDEVDSAGPPPDLTPIDPKVKKVNDEEVELSWDTPKDVDGKKLFTPLIYDIDFKEEEVEDWKALVRGVADTSYKATDMEPKKSYEFRVVPQVFQGFGDPWAEIVVPKRSVDQQKQKDSATAKAKGQERGVPPRMPFDAPKFSDLQKSSLKLTWDEATLPPGAKKVPITYVIEIKEGLGQGWKTLNDKIKDTHYNVKDIRADKEFSFRVMAKNEFGVSEPTFPATLNSRGGPPEMPFSKPKYTEVGPETVGLSWEPASNLKGMEDVPITYVIEMREPPSPDWETLVKNVKKTKVAIQDLHPSKNFSFRVLAENEYGVSEPTMPLTLPKRDAQYTPEEVRKPSYSLPSKSSVDITWKPSRMPVGCPNMPIVYDVEQCEYPSYDWSKVAKGVKDCEYTAKGLKPEKDYMYRVIARTQYAAADPSPSITARRKGGILVPQHVTLAKPLVKEVGENAAELSWRPAENPSNVTCPVTYVIEQRETMTSSWKEVATGIKDVKHVVEGLDPNKEYDFKVVPENEFGRADPYPIATLTRDGSRGKPPAGILITPSFSELGPDAVQLSWLPNKSNDPTQVTYVIEQRMLSGDWKQIADDVPDTYHNLHEVAPDVELVYRVIVKNCYGMSPPSPAVTVRRKAYSNMPEPIREKPTITDIGPAAIQLSWYPPLRRTDTPLTYTVEEKNPASGDWRVIAADLKDTRLDIENLVADRDYMYRVIVVNEYGKSEPSPAVMANQNLGGLKPDAIVEKPVISELGDGRYTLSWVIPREPQSPQDYTLEVQEAPSLRWQMVTTGIQDTHYILENLKPEQDYMYRVIVENDYGESDPSPAVSLRQGPESYAPVMPREKPYPREMGLDTILLSWKPAHIPAEAAASEITYVIEVREPPDTEWRKLYTKVPDVSHRMTDLMPKQDYMFRVLAQNEYGLSEPTPPCTVNRKSSKCIPEPILNHPRKTLVGPDAVQLTWPPPYQPAHLANIPMSYIIEVRDGLGSDWRPIAKDIKDPNYTVSGLRPDLGYGFRVRVANEYGVSEPSPVVALPTKWASDFIPRTPPDCPEITEVSIETVRVTWNAVRPPPGAPGTKVTYILEMREGKSTVWRPMVKGHPETSVLMKDVSPEHEYSFRVRAQNEYGISDPSRHATLPKRFALPEAILEKPFLLELGPDTAKISWRAPRLPTSLSRYQAKPYTYIIEVRDQSGNEWRKLAGDIRDTSYVIKDLLPDRDYLYRVRAQNEYGVSDPSLPVMKYKKSDTGRGSSASPAYTRKYLGPGFHRGHAAPEFVGDYDDTVYGVKEQPVKVSCTISGYPEPKLMWYKDGEKLELGGRFNVYVTANGLCTLEIDAMQKSDVGTYKIFAENTEGTATRYIRLELADPPVFLEPLKDLNLRLWTAGKMECRVDGLPYPEVKFFKDWHPLAHSARVKVKHTEYDYWSLDIDGAISRDEGMFICVAENIAGKVHCTASLHIEEKPPLVDIEIKPSNVSDFYHVLEEIGRGSCGVVRRVIEKCTHNEFAAKFLRARDKEHRNDLKQEFDAMAELSHPHIELLHDAFESNKKLVLVLELITGPELLDYLTELDSITENDVAFYIKQLLEAVEYLHSKGVLHLDIKPENLYFTKHGSTDIKLVDFGCARKTYHERETRINYGTPEFVAPEVVKGEPVTFATDCWHLGVLTYILLSGISPFHDSNDRQTLTNVRECRWSFKNQAFDDITDVAKNFIASLLDLDPRGRPTASDCLNHPFIRLADHRGQGLRLPVDRLKIYSTRRKFERQLNLVRTIVYQHPITSILQDVPRIMLPGDADVSKDRAPFSPISPSIGGPQGLLPPLACGIVLTPGTSRASSIAPSDDNTSSIDSGDYEFDLDDEGECPMEDWAGHYHPGAHTHCHHHDESKLKELKEKLQRTELDEKFAAVEAYIYKRSRSDRQKPKKLRKSKIAGGDPLVFKENLHDKGFNVGENITMSCQVHGNPAPSIHWYRNEEPLWDGNRLRSIYDHHTGRASLTVINTLPTDGGIYKCTARNPLGRIVTKARLAIGDHPTRPGRPVVTAVSSHEAFVMWEEPKSDGNGHILSYRLDYRKAGAREWTLGTHTINECALIQGLEPDSVYRFRVNCVNKFGTSPYSFGSIEIRTKHEGAEPIPIDSETRRVLLRSREVAEIHEDSEPESPDVSRRSSMYEVLEPKKEGLETDIMLQEGDPEKFYTFGAQIWSSEHATVLKCKDKNQGKEYIAKIRLKRSEDALREYNILKGLRQERICQLFEAYQTANKITLILEPLNGEELVRGLCFKNKYTEETVCHIIRQLLDALQFLHNYGIVHLNIEPSNIMMISRRRHDIKIVDFSCARNITHEDGESFGKAEGMTEFFAPEMLSNEMIGCPADVWSVGVVTFVLLSGESPFLGEKAQDTISNISRLRYDAHHLHDNITKDALRFMYHIIKRSPRDRLTIEEALDHRWLNLADPMVKKRRAGIFDTAKLRNFQIEFQNRRFAKSGSTGSEPSGVTFAEGQGQDERRDSATGAAGGLAPPQAGGTGEPSRKL